MSDANFASLSSSLLARKGGAKPAMRPQSGIQGPVDGKAAAANLEDLGWNDMGEDAPAPSAEPVVAVPAPRVVSIAPKKAAAEAEAGLTVPAPNQVRESIDRIQAQIEKPATAKAAAPAKVDALVAANAAASAPAPAVAAPVAAEIAAPVSVPAAVITAPRPAPAPRAPARRPTSSAAAAAMARRAAFTLRLDHERHLQLRLACTVRGRSAQQLVTDALDSLLAEMPEIASLAAQVKRDSH